MSLKTIREEKGLDQKTFAKILGVTQSCLSQWETGKTHPTIEKLKKFSKMLNCTMEQLIENKTRRTKKCSDE